MILDKDSFMIKQVFDCLFSYFKKFLSDSNASRIHVCNASI